MNEQKMIQLFCIPYAGGMAEAFEGLQPWLDDSVQLIPLEYAGHGKRRKESYYRDFEELAKDMAEQIRSHRRDDCDYMIFGYSMGSVAAYEVVTREMKEDRPKHIFLAAHEAPDVEWESKEYMHLDEDAFLDMLIALGGFGKIEKKTFGNKFFRKLYLEPIREDYRLLGGYRMKEKRLLPAGTTIFYSPKDKSTQHIRTWDSFSEEPVEYIPLGETHFFIREHAHEIAETINKKSFV